MKQRRGGFLLQRGAGLGWELLFFTAFITWGHFGGTGCLNLLPWVFRFLYVVFYAYTEELYYNTVFPQAAIFDIDVFPHDFLAWCLHRTKSHS